MRKIKSLVSFLIFILLSTQAFAATYYIAMDGDDTNCDGSTTDPYDGAGGPDPCAFQTIQKGVTSATTAGDTVIVQDGTYTGQVTISSYSGSAAAEKVVENVTKANPPVVTVTGHGYSNGDVVAFNWFDEGMTQLRIHWFTVANATTDTFELSGINSTSWDAYTTGATVRKVTPITIKAANRGSAIVDLGVTVSGWTVYSGNVWVSSSLGIGTGKTAYLWSVGNTTLFEKRETSLAQVNAEADYFYDSTAQLMYLYTTTNPNTLTYKSNYLSGITIRGVSYILLDGFDIRFTTPAITVGAESGITQATTDIYMNYITLTYADGLGGITVNSNTTYPARRITLDNANMSLVNDLASGSNGHCIKFAANTNAVDGRYVSVSNSTLHTFRYQGIQFSNGWSYGDFRNNNIYNIAPQNSGGGSGIRTGHPSETTNHSYVRIYDNDIGGGAGDTGYGVNTPIYIQEDSNDVMVYRNTLHDDGWHGIYIFSVTTTRNAYDIQIFNNKFYRLKVSGIRIEQSDSVEIYNNSFYECGSDNFGSTYAALSLNDGTGVDKASGVVFKNNAVKNLAARTIGALSGTNLTSDYNDLYTEGSTLLTVNGQNYTSLSTYRQTTYNDLHSVTLDPLYTNAPTDLTTLSASPTRGAGTSLTSLGYFTNDYSQTERRNIWDIGAYEQSAETTVTGLRIGN